MCTGVEAVDTLRVVSPDPVLESWRWTTIDRGNAAEAGFIHDLLYDGDGTLWLATSRGLQHYDGYGWQTVTVQDGLVDSMATSLLRSRKGDLWVGTRNGISRFDGETWHSYTEGLPDQRVALNGLCETRDGSIYAGFGQRRGDNPGEVARFDGETWQNLALPDGAWQPQVVFGAVDGALWIGTDRGLLRWQGGEYTHFPEARAWDLAETPDGTLWAVWDARLSHFDGERWIAEDTGLERMFSSLWVDDDGTLWAAGTRKS